MILDTKRVYRFAMYALVKSKQTGRMRLVDAHLSRFDGRA